MSTDHLPDVPPMIRVLFSYSVRADRFSRRRARLARLAGGRARDPGTARDRGRGLATGPETARGLATGPETATGRGPERGLGTATVGVRGS